MLDFLLDLDKQLFLALNGLNNGFFDQVMYYISEKVTWIPLYALLLFLIFKRFRWRGLVVLLLVVVLVTLSDQLSVLMKNSFLRLRPCHEPALEGLVHIVRGHCGGRYGFVSSHAANTFALATFMTFLLGDRFQWVLPLMFAYAGLNAYSRIYLGVHYPGDVIFGALLGVFIGLLVWWLWDIFLGFFPEHKTDKTV
ncbi:MAG: phosphatase PAP2 family protein [Bacteroidales bacterium]|jgi:undecaprenyl-diphosphatase|nr:phosphatase PAP2 family protein [Bacteroidales bacterium]NLM91525.1 phosphatase PAP2 family protein [Bacteroidales bacterium]